MYILYINKTLLKNNFSVFILIWQGIGNGFPLGAVVTTPEIAEVLTHRNYFNTFGGNPVSTAAGLAVLKVIEKEQLQKNALEVGSYLKERLTTLKDKYECNIFTLLISFSLQFYIQEFLLIYACSVWIKKYESDFRYTFSSSRYKMKKQVFNILGVEYIIYNIRDTKLS